MSTGPRSTVGDVAIPQKRGRVKLNNSLDSAPMLDRLWATVVKRAALSSVQDLALSSVGGLFSRYAIHLTVLGLTALVLALSAAPQVDAVVASPLTTSVVGPVVLPQFETFITRGFFADNGNTISRLADSHTSIPFRTRRGVIIYQVQPADTVQAIAVAFGLQPQTIMWSNSAIEDLPDLLRVGQEVVVLPIDGVYHEVQEGDTLASIVSKYKTDIDAIIGEANEWNALQPPNYEIVPGTKLIVAGGTKPYVPKVVTAYNGPIPTGARGTGRFQWPTLGRISQGYWYGHRALDIAAPTGTPSYAADGGFVTFVGWTDIGYGNLVRIDHGNGLASYYGHLNGFNVVLGQAVQRGDLIGYVGSTGNSTGPHLHFEIRSSNGLLNPRVYLP